MVIVNNGNDGNPRVVHGDGDGVQNRKVVGIKLLA